MGIPGKPGSDTLSKRLEQLNSRKQRRAQGASGMTRPDLGTVSTLNSPQQQQLQPSEHHQQQSTTLGTLSTLLFGRKGGLF